jgi:hypothetical protein
VSLSIATMSGIVGLKGIGLRGHERQSLSSVSRRRRARD